ncbi:MAG: hypothetical protein Q9207_001287 [Kuettlingeria erythrocarpa]
MASRSSLLDTAQALVSAYNSWNLKEIMGVRSIDCVHFILPASLGRPAMDNEGYASYFAPNIPLFEGFHLTVHDTIIDQAARKVTMHLSSSGTTAIGKYDNEYMLTLHMTEDGRKVDRFEEFVDSKYSARYMSELRDSVAQSSKMTN